MISARINGQKTELLLDSGAAVTAINYKFADYFGVQIDPARQMRITAASVKEIDTFLATVQELRVGSVIRKNLPVAVIVFPPRFEVHGLSGMNFLKGLRFTVEMDTGALILREAKKR